MAQPAFSSLKVAEKTFLGLARRGGQTAGRIKQLGPFRTKQEAEAAAREWSQLPLGKPVAKGIVNRLRAF